MLRVTLGELVEQVRDEARLSTNTSRSLDHLSHIKQVLRTCYRQLAEEYDWPHLRLKRSDCTKTLAAGQRYYDFPVNLNTDKMFSAWVLWGSSWSELCAGITNEHYSSMDSDTDQRADPPLRWEWYSNTDLNQFEIWPVPASASTVAFEGQKKVTPLLNDADRCDIDDLLLVLKTAAIVTADKLLKPQLGARYTERQTALIGNQRSSIPRGIVIGGSDGGVPRHRGRDIRYVRG